MVQVGAFVGALAVTAIALSSLGMLIASRVRSIENFAAVMNFLIFPMFFLSGALYPATRLPAFLQPVVLGNPLTYGVDLMRRALLPVGAPAAMPGEFPVGLSLGLLLGFSVAALPLAARLFGREEHLSGILLTRPPRAPLHSSARKAR
jgi:ABC-2 type transport system permease protein